MTFWGTEKLREKLKTVVPEGKAERVKQGSYELALGQEVYLSGDESKTMLDLGQIISIEPGRTALLLTLESVAIPHDAVGFISLKSRAKLPGLINVSGFHVDPGFSGKLVFTVFNAGTEPQTFTCGEPLFLLWLSDMDPVSDPYQGDRSKQEHLSGAMCARLTGKGVSPAALEKRLRKVEKAWKERKMLLWALVLGVAIAIFQGFPFARFGERLGNWLMSPAAPAPTGEKAPGSPVARPAVDGSPGPP